MSAKEKIKDWFFALSQEKRDQIDEQIEKIRSQEDEAEKHNRTLTHMVKELARMLEDIVDDPSQISIIIKVIADGRISDDLIEKVLPEEKKRKHKPYERYQEAEIRQSDFQRPVTVASDGSTHTDITTQPERIDLSEDKGRGAWIDPNALRIIMRADLFNALGRDMQQKVREHGKKTLYAIEYNSQSKEVFTDIAETGEEVNAT